MTRRIFVTGGTGYVGSALVPELAKRWPVIVYCLEAFGNAIAGTPNVTFVQGDIRDSAKVSGALRGCTDVIHLAGVVTDELVDMNPAKARQVNEDAMRGLCDAARIEGVERFIYMSSSSIYGTQPEIATEYTEPKPMTEYARQKLAGEFFLFYYKPSQVLCAIRSATLCGPAPRMRLDTIVNVFSKQAYFDGVITVHGGDQWRTNINVRDMVDLYLTLLNAPAEKIHREIFNATTENHTALDLARLVAAVAENYLGRPIGVSVDSTKHDPRQYRMSAEKLARVLGWRSKHTIEEAIRANFDFFKEGKVGDPNADLYYNNRRMAASMKEA